MPDYWPSRKCPAGIRDSPRPLRERWHIPGECAFRAEGTEDLNQFIPGEGASLVTQPVKNQPATQGTRLIPGSAGSPREGIGYPLQYPGLENSMDCIVLGVPKSRTRLSNFHSHFDPRGAAPSLPASFCGEEHKNLRNKNAVNPRPPPPRLVNILFRERRGMFKTYSHSESECKCLYI